MLKGKFSFSYLWREERIYTSDVKLITDLPQGIVISSSGVIVVLKNKMPEASFQSLLNPVQKRKKWKEWSMNGPHLAWLFQALVEPQWKQFPAVKTATLPFQLILMIIEKDEYPAKISHLMFLHHCCPVNTTKVNKILPSKVCAISINISRAFLQVLLGMSWCKWYDWCIGHCLPQNPSRMALKSTTFNHEVRL